MKLDDVKLPPDHVIVSTGDRKMGAGEFMQVVGDTTGPYYSIDPSRPILYPEGFRVVPQALVSEWHALLDRQQREIDEFRGRVDALPQIHVEVSIR